MKREEDEELWDLLGRGRQLTLSPFFARNVVRQIRQQPQWRQKLGWWFAPRRLLPAGAVAIALLLTTLSFRPPVATPPSVENPQDSLAQLDSIDYQVVADLDDLLAMEDDSLWSDADISTL
ncbi:MAG: hypothetical protein ACR2ID_08260 [Chthoniobacterales bacterium]